MSLHPTHGARVLFERVSSEEREASYKVEVFTPDQKFEGRVKITSASHDLTFDREPPTDALAIVRALLRPLSAKVREGDAPRRLMRWRATE
jgi:hypothetical protein